MYPDEQFALGEIEAEIARLDGIEGREFKETEPSGTESVADQRQSA